MEWLQSNWLWILFVVAVFAMHMFGHGGHGHGSHGGGHGRDGRRHAHDWRTEEGRDAPGAEASGLSELAPEAGPLAARLMRAADSTPGPRPARLGGGPGSLSLRPPRATSRPFS